MTTMEAFSLGAFREAVDTDFRVVLDGPEVKLRLMRIDEMVVRPDVEQFSLLLKGPLELFLTQQIYRLQHECFGEQELFMVPIGRESDGFIYEVSFNLLIPVK